MNARIDEIAPDVHRISIYAPEFDMEFNHFLVRDEEPLLYHTGMRKMFPVLKEAVARVIDPRELRWIGYSHFEPDECGALNEWSAVAPRVQALSGFVGAMVMLQDYADRPGKTLADGEVLPLGRHRLRYLATPHVPHGWDAGFFFDETERTFLCSDLFFHPGDPEPVTEADIVGRAREAIVQGAAGPLANDMPYTPYTDATFRRLADLRPRTLALMHGSTFRGDGGKAIAELGQIVREMIGPDAAARG